MMEIVPWALSTEWPVKILATVGGATVGALAIGWLVRLLAKLVFVQPVPCPATILGYVKADLQAK